jgi:hypothetical protein
VPLQPPSPQTAPIEYVVDCFFPVSIVSVSPSPKTLLNIASMFQDTKMVVESRSQHFYSRMAMSSYFHHDQRVVKKLFDNYQGVQLPLCH